MKYFKKTDLIIVAIILLVSVIIWFIYGYFTADKRAKAEIYYYSKLVKTVDLNNRMEETFSIPQNQDVVFHLSQDGTIEFEQSNCPDQVCIHAGKLGTVGQYAACLPNGIVMKIVPEKDYREDNVDIVVGN